MPPADFSGMLKFVENLRKRREILVPLQNETVDVRSRENLIKKCPDLGGSGGGVAVHERFPVPVTPRNVDLDDIFEWEPLQKCSRVQAMIHCIGVKVRQIKQQATAGSANKLGEKVRLVEFGAGESDVVGDVLKNKGYIDEFADDFDVVAERVERVSS